MKFMNKFQCLMGGNTAVQFQHSSLVTQSSSSSVMLLQNTTSTNDASSSSSIARDHKKKKLKKKKQKKIKDGKVIKVFKPDGEINVYKKAIKVSEVMTEELMVCRSDSFYIGQKIPPLEQHDRLQPGHTYFLLPSHLFHSVLSFVTIASFTSSSKQHQDDHVAADDSRMKAAFLKKAAASSCSPFDIQKTPSGTLRIRVSELFISQLMMDQASSSKGDHLVNLDTSTTLAADLLCTTPQLHKEYKQLVVGSRRGWKPKLEMIKETPPSKGSINKRKVKMLLSASINRMKTKLKNKKNKKVVGLAQISSSSSSTPKKKKKTAKKKKTKKSPVSPSSSASLKANKFYNSGYRIAEKKPADVVM